MRKLLNSASKKDFKIDFYKAPGKGGQNKNKRDTACRFTHIETGITAKSEKFRTQGRNKKEAFRKVAKLLVEHWHKKEEKPRPNKEAHTRTYHEADNRVTDHITGKQYSYKRTVGKGDIGQIIEDRAEHGIRQ